jgi:endogenous inhibitor of DNA gyrase (YacG/DUF329 family)
MQHNQARCFECGETFITKRTDRQFCSGRCRSANFRRVQSEKLRMLERLFEQYVPKLEVETKTKFDLFA